MVAARKLSWCNDIDSDHAERLAKIAAVAGYEQLCASGEQERADVLVVGVDGETREIDLTRHVSQLGPSGERVP